MCENRYDTLICLLIYIGALEYGVFITFIDSNLKYVTSDTADNESRIDINNWKTLWT